jgi:alpha-tubulin suppressor-like RCC1 family protein
VAAGNIHTVVLKTDGTVRAWGGNAYGQCNVPVDLGTCIAIAAGWLHTLALKTDGTVRAWGWNDYGQCNVPVDLGACTAVAASWRHTVALRSDGTVRAWGHNEFCQCNVPFDVGNIGAIASGEGHTLALRPDGTLRAWGLNTDGQCNVPGDLAGVTAIAGGDDHTIAVKGDGTVVAWGRNDQGQCNVPGDLTNAIAVTAGYDHTVALKNDGTVRAWGGNALGQCNVPGDLTQVTAIGAGGYHSVALKSDGTVVAWGDNGEGQCSVPGDLTNVIALAAGYRHTVALKSDGTVRTWGWNVYGQCNVPVDLGDATAIAAGYYHTVALRSDGTVRAWGRNDYYQCDVPSDLAGVTAIAGGGVYAVALALGQPAVSSITPNQGPTAGGQAVTIAGSNLWSVTSVSFGGTPAPVFNLINSTTITCTTPAHPAGWVDVNVGTPWGTKTLPNGYRYIASPTVTVLAPDRGPTTGHTGVTITGTSFVGVTDVTFGSTPASNLLAVSETSLVCSTPAHPAGSVSVSVTAAGGTGTRPNAYRFVDPPVVTSVTPGAGPSSGGTSVTIAGANFVSVSAVAFGGDPAGNVQVISETSLTCSTPAHHPGAVHVTVMAVGGAGVGLHAFRYGVVWTGQAHPDTRASTPANWLDNATPSAGDALIFPEVAHKTVLFDSAAPGTYSDAVIDAAAYTLEVDTGFAVTFTSTVTAGTNSLTIGGAGDMTAAGAFEAGACSKSGAGTLSLSGPAMFHGVLSALAGTLNVQGQTNSGRLVDGTFALEVRVESDSRLELEIGDTPGPYTALQQIVIAGARPPGPNLVVSRQGGTSTVDVRLVNVDLVAGAELTVLENSTQVRVSPALLGNATITKTAASSDIDIGDITALSPYVLTLGDTISGAPTLDAGLYGAVGANVAVDIKDTTARIAQGASLNAAATVRLKTAGIGSLAIDAGKTGSGALAAGTIELGAGRVLTATVDRDATTPPTNLVGATVTVAAGDTAELRSQPGAGAAGYGNVHWDKVELGLAATVAHTSAEAELYQRVLLLEITGSNASVESCHNRLAIVDITFVSAGDNPTLWLVGNCDVKLAGSVSPESTCIKGSMGPGKAVSLDEGFCLSLLGLLEARDGTSIYFERTLWPTSPPATYEVGGIYTLSGPGGGVLDVRLGQGSLTLDGVELDDGTEARCVVDRGSETTLSIKGPIFIRADAHVKFRSRNGLGSSGAGTVVWSDGAHGVYMDSGAILELVSDDPEPGHSLPMVYLVGATGSIQNNHRPDGVEIGTVFTYGSLTLEGACDMRTYMVRGSGGLRKGGANRVVLYGPWSDYQGTTEISSGTLRVNTELRRRSSPVNILTQGRLEGRGVIKRPVAAAPGGRISPGSSIDTLTVGEPDNPQTVTLGTLEVDIDKNAVGQKADKLVIYGSLNLSSGDDRVAVMAGSDMDYSQSPYVIMTYTDTATGIVDFTEGLDWPWRITNDTVNKRIIVDLTPPTVTGTAPPSGPPAGGTGVTISGTDFDTAGVLVDFGGAAALNAVPVSSTEITCSTTVHAPGVVDVTVTNCSYGLSGRLDDGYEYMEPPTVGSIMPAVGPTSGGQRVSIFGANFAGPAEVKFDTTVAITAEVISPTQITCSTPAHAEGHVDVTVINRLGQSDTLEAGYQYVLPATVSSITPTSGRMGGHKPPACPCCVTITGDGFTTPATVHFDAETAGNVQVVNLTTITCETPPHAAGPADVILNIAGNEAILPDGYAYCGYEGDLACRTSLGDEGLTAGDLAQARRFVAGLDTPAAGPEFQRADVAPRSPDYGDGELSAGDLIQQRRYVAGLDPLTAAGGPTE